LDVLPSDDPRGALARRLRALRQEHWADRRITQTQLAKAFSIEKPVSGPLISSWESPNNPTVPPPDRLAAYATFFATERSVARTPYRMLSVRQLTEQERAIRAALLSELVELRLGATGETWTPGQPQSMRGDSPPPGGLWYFPDVHPVTIVCSALPADMRATMPYSYPDDPDFVELYRYSDLDALIELFGHIRAANPKSPVRFRTAAELTADDYTTHLVLLGGVDWNVVTRDLQERRALPVGQIAREDESEVSGFEVFDTGERLRFTPTMREVDGRQLLIEDVAYFHRSTSPYNAKRTVSICNGCYARGTVGSVRALTDTRFRDRNDAYVRSRFVGADTFTVVFRVFIVNGQVVTPDWTVADNRLYEWPEGPE
jgi:hypothetical protein